VSDPCTCDWQAPHGDPCRTTSYVRPEPYGREYRAGAAAAFGLMGMAFAIRKREAQKGNAEIMTFYNEHGSLRDRSDPHG